MLNSIYPAPHVMGPGVVAITDKQCPAVRPRDYLALYDSRLCVGDTSGHGYRVVGPRGGLPD